MNSSIVSFEVVPFPNLPNDVDLRAVEMDYVNGILQDQLKEP